MRRAIVALVLLLSPLPALAQNALTVDQNQNLQQKLKEEKIVVQPRPDAETVQRDANQAIDQLAAEQRRDATLRDLNRPMPQRPDLTEPVYGGIQTRNLNKALQGR